MFRAAHIIVSLLVLLVISSANDGVYLTHGGIFYPTKETRIVLAKEHLSFDCNGDHCSVQVLFEFDNPDSLARDLMVGFQAPTSAGDVSDSLIKATLIQNLKVMVDGALLPIIRKVAECEECPLGDPTEIEFHQENPGIYVYLFEVTFQPGITRVQHSYDFTASSNVAFDKIFNYILTTGSKWAGSTIRDLTVEIDMGKDQYFYVADVFGKDSDWSIVGTGIVTNHVFNYDENITCRMVRILSGKLKVHAQNLEPMRNIEFGVSNSSNFFGIPLENESDFNSKVLVALRESTIDMVRFGHPPLTKEDLRLLRNTIYAQHGYAFKDKNLRTLYERFAWYIPDPSIKDIEKHLTSEETRFIREIILQEANIK